jgi:hypothetical protein
MSYPYVGRDLRPKSGNLADATADASGVEERRMPTFPPRQFCRHKHSFANCSICVTEWERLMGFVAPRR